MMMHARRTLLLVGCLGLLGFACGEGGEDKNDSRNLQAETKATADRDDGNTSSNIGASPQDTATTPSADMGNPASPAPGANTGGAGETEYSNGSMAGPNGTAGAGAKVDSPPPLPPAEPIEPQDAQWVQLSTDDSTSMASAQMFKARFPGRSLKAHEFLNYYDPPAGLFEAETWAVRKDLAGGLELGLKGESLSAPDADVACDGQAGCNAEGSGGVFELLFQLRAPVVSMEARRNWNIYLCVDVSGSMRGEKIAFVRDALVKMLSHFKAGDRLTLITFDSISHDVFMDLELSASKTEIENHFRSLSAGNSTNMIAGLRRVYELAQNNHKVEMLQRVIIFSDGNANVGDTDIATFANLTRMNGQEGIYLSGVGVGNNYDWHRMEQLTDAGKGAHVFLPNAQEVDLIFGDYFDKLIEVAADNIAIEMEFPEGVSLIGFSGEEVSTNPQKRLQNIVLAAGDDMTFTAAFAVKDPAALDKPANLKLTLTPLTTGEDIVVEAPVQKLRDVFAPAGRLFQRTRLIHRFGKLAAQDKVQGEPGKNLLTDLNAYENPDWAINELKQLIPGT